MITNKYDAFCGDVTQNGGSTGLQERGRGGVENMLECEAFFLLRVMVSVPLCNQLVGDNRQHVLLFFSICASDRVID
jgi:hypothetical protein